MTRSKGRTGRPWRRAAARLKRTGSICWLCGDPIDPALDYRDPMAFTADHITPVAHLPEGHPLLNDVRNLRAAHRKCNSSRGTGDRKPPTPLPTSRAWLG